MQKSKSKFSSYSILIPYLIRKVGSSSSDLSTPSGSTISQTIRLLYGQSIARDMLQVSVPSDVQEGEEDLSIDNPLNPDEEPVKWKGEALITNANYQAKRMTFLLFINRKYCPYFEGSDCLIHQ